MEKEEAYDLIEKAEDKVLDSLKKLSAVLPGDKAPGVIIEHTSERALRAAATCNIRELLSIYSERGEDRVSLDPALRKIRKTHKLSEEQVDKILDTVEEHDEALDEAVITRLRISCGFIK